MSKQSLALKDKLAYYLLKDVNKAIYDYQMIADGDRIAVGISGGKDSFALLRLLRLRQNTVPEKYEIVAVHVVMHRSNGTSCAGLDLRSILVPYFELEQQAYAFEIVDVGAQLNCYRCSYLRRKAIFSAAQRLGCNKVALGHHADDAAQTTLLNLFFHGKAETLSPKRQFFDGQFVLIRPMIYVPEKEIARFAQVCAFPLTAVHCPHSTTSRRALIQNIIHAVAQEYPKVKINLLRAGLRQFFEAKYSELEDEFRMQLGEESRQLSEYNE